jgi:hypothetical protein
VERTPAEISWTFFSQAEKKIHSINELILIPSEKCTARFVPGDQMQAAKKHSPFGRAAFARLLRHPGLAVPKYSCTLNALQNGRPRLVKNAR